MWFTHHIETSRLHWCLGWECEKNTFLMKLIWEQLLTFKRNRKTWINYHDLYLWQKCCCAIWLHSFKESKQSIRLICHVPFALFCIWFCSFGTRAFRWECIHKRALKKIDWVYEEHDTGSQMYMYILSKLD